MDIEIIDYKPEFGTHFELLNKAWLVKYFRVEPMDEYMLSNPEEAIIRKGGHVFFALADGAVAGTVALIRVDNDRVELAKLAVDERFRRMGIGDRLLKQAIHSARMDGFKEVVLYSHTKLESALSLYRRNHFVEVPLTDCAFKRANLMMSLRLDPMIRPDVRYPIGQFEKPAVITPSMLAEWIARIQAFPEMLRQEVIQLTDEQLDTPYREGGWTVRQVVHHCADSHMNALVRIKLAITGNSPVISPYDEARWAELPDSKALSVVPSLTILTGLHERWVVVLKNLTESDLRKTYIHPEHNKAFPLDEAIGMYAWHGNHHLAHIKRLKEKMGWD